MAPITLPMKPTGWFQVAWSAEVAVGQVVPVHYLGHELVVYRTEDGAAHVLNAYCEHLGAHLGFGGTVKGDCIVCPFHGWEWDPDGRNTMIPYQTRPNRVRRVRSWPVRERNECIYIWHDLAGRTPLFEVPDVFSLFDGGTADDYFVGYPEGCATQRNVTVHPQYVIENGVDFAHFKFVHRAHDVPHFTRQEFDDWSFYGEFEMDFSPSRSSAAAGGGKTAKGVVKALNVGISLGYSLTWATDRLRLQVAVTPVDDERSDLWSTVWLERPAGTSESHQPQTLQGRMRIANNQFLADVRIWEHLRYTDPAGLAASETKSFNAVRRWAKRFYPEVDPTSVG